MLWYGIKSVNFYIKTKLFKWYYLDFGSAIDLICTKRDSRGREYDYIYIEKLLSEILPNDWNDSQFEYIYQEAKNTLGIHLPK